MDLQKIDKKIREIEAQRQMHIDNAKACMGAIQVLSQMRAEEEAAIKEQEEEDLEGSDAGDTE